MCRIGPLDLEGGVDHLNHALVFMGSGPPGPQFVVQAPKSLLEVATASLADGDVAQSHAPGDGRVGLTLGTGQHDLRALHDRVGQ